MTSPILSIPTIPVPAVAGRNPIINPCPSPVVGFLPAYGGNPSRYIVMAAGALSLAAVVSGCNAPQPAQPTPAPGHSAPAPIPGNQSDCTPANTDEFCRHMLGTERRVENMRAGRDEYNNHNTILVELAFGGGALTVALAFATFFGVRGLRRRAKARAEARAAAQAAEPPTPPPAKPETASTSETSASGGDGTSKK